MINLVIDAVVFSSMFAILAGIVLAAVHFF
jgi:hypothetical protein